MMEHEKALFLKYLDGKAGQEEKQQLLNYIKNNPDVKQELQPAYNEWVAKNCGAFDSYESLNSVLNKVSRKRLFPIPAAVALAAAVLAAVLVIPQLHRQHSLSNFTADAGLYTWPESETPAVLLPDGKTIHSDAIEMQVSCTLEGVRIDGCEYTLADSPKAQCMVAVPYGHRAFVQFADGSSVHVNAHSRLVFPLRFGKERNIAMTGEALFDVSRDESRPFVVGLDGVKVTVLGTRFLVSGQDKEPSRVALISGSVNVSLSGSNTQSVTLVPNQMYTMDDNGKINIEDISDWGGMLDWADGVYRADGTPLTELLSYLSRYYGESVECDARVSGISCTGTLNLKPTLSDMLSELSNILSIKSRKQNGVWFVSLSN